MLLLVLYLGAGLTLLLLIVAMVYVVHLRRALAKNQAELEIAQRGERRFAESFWWSPIPFSLSNRETGQMTEVNNAYVKTIGWSYDELVGRTNTELGIVPPAARASILHHLKRRGSVRDLPLTLTRKDGQLREVVLAMDTIELDGVPHVLTTVIDQTEHKRAVAALQSTDQRMRELAAAIDEVFWITSPDRRQMLYVSPAYEKVWGRTCESVMTDPESCREAILPDDLARLEQTPERHEYEYRILRPDGATRWIRTREFPVRAAAGEILRLAGVSTDVTEQRALEEQLSQSQKLESLGMLAGGIAHDFNNLLAVISSCSGLLAETIDQSHPDHELVDDISSAVVRASVLTRQLLSFTRKHVTEAVVLDPNLVVTETCKLLRRIVGVNIEILTSLAPDLRTVRIDRGQLVQVLLNLAINARDAMPTRGSLSLSTRNVGDRVTIEVTDTGSGMPEEVLARACEPFFTTKEHGKGTGLGLAVVRNIVETAGGTLEIESRVGIGTTFRVCLPAREGAAQADAATPTPSRGAEAILVVDDDDYVRRSTTRALRARGYTVTEAVDARAALVTLNTAKFDLMLTDIVMPGMNGRVLSEAARARHPDLKILMMTGYTDDEVVRLGVSRGEVELLEKPFTIPALSAKVRDVLDRAPSDEVSFVVPAEPAAM